MKNIQPREIRAQYIYDGKKMKPFVRLKLPEGQSMPPSTGKWILLNPDESYKLLNELSRSLEYMFFDLAYQKD